MTTASERKRSDLDREEADKLWSRVTEIGDQVSVLDKTVGVLVNEVHGIRSTLSEVARTVREVGNSLNESRTSSKEINWQALSVAVFVVASMISGAYYLLHREVEHVSQMNTLSHTAIKESEALRSEADYWKIKAEAK